MSKQDEKKEAIIRKLYYDPAGLGSIKNTLKDVSKVDTPITEAEEKKRKESNTERKKNLKGNNNLIANEPKKK